MKYMVYWIDMLKKKQGDAPMRAFDTTIEGKSYILGFVDAVVMHTKGSKNKENYELMKEFVIERIDKNAK